MKHVRMQWVFSPLNEWPLKNSIQLFLSNCFNHWTGIYFISSNWQGSKE